MLPALTVPPLLAQSPPLLQLVLPSGDVCLSCCAASGGIPTASNTKKGTLSSARRTSCWGGPPVVSLPLLAQADPRVKPRELFPRRGRRRRISGRLRLPQPCSTLYDMAVLTVRIDDRLDEELRNFVARTGEGKSAFVREALRRHLALARLKDLRRRVAPLAEARGWLTDEDVFAEIS